MLNSPDERLETLSEDSFTQDHHNIENASEFYEEDNLEDIDEESLAKFFPQAPFQRQNLSDLILQRIQEHEAKKINGKKSLTSPPNIDKRVVSVYTKVGFLLSRYKSGKLPKAFKVIPTLKNWEEILMITQPMDWTPNATYQATKIFISVFQPKEAQKFLNYVILDKVREDIQENKKLNYHYYMALKKALYKPSAFFKGFLFPLVSSGSCTLREAVIISSILRKVSIPVLHSAAALLKLSEMNYSGCTSLFMRTLLDKKYALPFKVVDALVFHFLSFRKNQTSLPVLWHQSLLVFCQRYKNDISPDQKAALIELSNLQNHHAISPEIQRELSSSQNDSMETDVMNF